MAATYEPLATTTLTGTSGSVVFSSISQTYTDLVLIVAARDSRTETNDGFGIQFNSDTSSSSTNYSDTYLYGYSSSTNSGRNTSVRQINVHQVTAATYGDDNYYPTTVVRIGNYSNSNGYKTLINRGGVVDELYFATGTWRNTAAITSITIWPGYNGSGYTFYAGSTFTLYGIKAA